MPPALNRFGVIVIWLLLLGALSWVFHGVITHQANPNRRVEVVRAADGRHEVVLARNKLGHYVASGSINRRPVVFLLDTGATHVAVSPELAARAGLAKGAPVTLQTANGLVTGYATSIASVSLGAIEIRNVRADINPGMQGDEVLLGMSFLRHLKFAQHGDELRLSLPQ